MKVFKFLLSLIITLVLVYALNTSLSVGKTKIPPLGKFLSPFHGFWQNSEPGDYTPPAELSLPGLKDKVTILYDSQAIPHIFASNDHDLYLAQGFVTAQHRLWQMEIQTHAAAGRVSEIVGQVALDNDRAMRRLGMVYGAEHALKAMMTNDTARIMVEAYTAGVNAYIETLTDRTLPFEYKLLDYKPEPWTNLKCALLLKNMCKTLSMGDKDMEMTNALALYGTDVVELLYPDVDIYADPVVNRPGKWKFTNILSDTIPYALPAEIIKVSKLPKEDPTTGSNNWAVAGSKTRSGSPILCGDPHLNLSLPSIWYAIQLHAPGANTMGVSLPGAPGIIIGFNDSIAWSVTNAQRDLADWFKITYRDGKKDQYKLDGAWKNTTKVVEQFHVRGKETVIDTVIYTHWGPVTYDKNYHAENNLNDYSFRWMAHDPSLEVLAVYKLNRAKNHADYTEALNYFLAPPQNFVFAAVSGDIAMRVQGKYPARRKGEGKFVLDGSKSSNGWQAYIPNEQNAAELNPIRGFVSSANQHPADSTYPYFVTATHFETYRNRRINQVLSESDSITVQDMMNLQHDNYNLKAAESLPFFLSQLDTVSLSQQEQTAIAILKDWNYYNDVESEGASYYEAWWDNLMALLWDEMENDSINLERPTTYHTIHLLKNRPDLAFADIQKTKEKETVKDVIHIAFKLGVEDIEKWKNGNRKAAWADYKDSYIGHLLRLEPLNIHVRAGGNHDIVNALSKTHGPSWRMVVSLEQKGVQAWAIYPGGQSGNPGSIHYNDMVTRWVTKNYFKLHFLKTAAKAEATFFQQTLTPAK